MTEQHTTIQTLWQAGDYVELERRLWLQRAAGGDDDTIVWSALSALTQGKLDAAYRYLSPLAARSPRKGEVQALLGRIADELNLPNLRLQAWQAAVNAEPANMTYRVRLAKYHADRGNPGFGRAIIDALLRTNKSIVASAPAPLPATTGRAHLPDNSVVILVPVYADLAASRACIESVLQSLEHNRCSVHLLLINDASPSAELAGWLRSLAHNGEYKHLELLEHAENQGFIHTVNEGLCRHPGHDVVLLNADTLVHGNWLDRLRAAANSQEKVASVTPLSNFGELVSFPRPMFNNPLVSAAQVENLDKLAAQVNAGAGVEIPVGVGFCLYLRHQAITEVGVLDAEHYQRGYGEEVDLCLRFARAGYTNLCAADVYVGHRGTTSFKAEKPILAARNNQVLHRRYPSYRAAYDAFLLRDPLAVHRRAMEGRLLTGLDRPARLLRLPPEEDIALRLRAQAASTGVPMLMAWCDHNQTGDKWRLLLEAGLDLTSLQYNSKAELEQQLAVLAANTLLEPVSPAILAGIARELRREEDDAVPAVTGAGAAQVIAVYKGPRPLQEYAVIEAVARHIATHNLPIQLWLQYATVNMAALLNLGCVWQGQDWRAIDRRTHLQAGGCTGVWHPDAQTPYDSPQAIGAIINGW